MRSPTTTLLLAVVLTLASMPARADTLRQPAAQERSNRGRVLGTVIGAAGGFALGLVAGLTWFDDAVNSDRKVWTTAIGFAGAGGAAGYFLGRSLDRPRRRQPAIGPALEPLGLDLPRHLKWRNWPRDLPRAR